MVCCSGSSRKLLYHDAVKFTASDQLADEDGLREKSSHAVASPFLQTDQHTSSQQEETFLSDSSSDDDEPADVNYTLVYDVTVLESELDEAVAGTGHEGVVDAAAATAADVSKFPSKNDL